jgi:hypothetical protein
MGDGPEVTVVPGGRVAVPLPQHADLALPVDFAPLVELQVRPKGGSGLEAVRRVTLRP